MLSLLVRLRYRLVWATVRNRTGGWIGLLVAIILSVGIGILLLISTLSITSLAEQFGGRVTLARWVLSGLLANAAAITLATGRGLRSGFSMDLLRRFPISPIRLFCFRHLIAFCDPIWFLFGATVIALVAAYASGRAAIAPTPVFGGALFICFSYMCVAVAGDVIERLLSRRSGSTLVYGVVLVCSVAAPLMIVSCSRAPNHVVELVDRCLDFLPPGLAASAIVDAAGLRALELIAWCVLAGAGLFLFERTPVQGGGRRTASAWAWLSHVTTACFGPETGPLMTKALLYQLRCNRVRLNFVLTIPMTVLLPVWMGRNGGADAVYSVQLALFFLSAGMATNVVVLNQFGFDGAGLERYLLVPGPFARVLRAASFASVVMGGAVIVASLIAWLGISSIMTVKGSLWMLAVSGISGLFLFNAIGLWTSVLVPRSVRFEGITGTQLSWQGTLVQGGAIAAALGTGFVAPALQFSSILSGWGLPPFYAALMITVYLVSLSRTSRLVTALRHEIRCRIRTPA